MPFDWRTMVQGWLDAARRFAADLPAMLAEAKGQFREDPWGGFQLPVVRMILLSLAVIVTFAMLTLYASSGSPAEADRRGAEPIRATYRVSCTHSGCDYQWTIEESTDYDNWPIRCPGCGAKSGWRLVRCPHPQCAKRVVPRVESDGRRVCPECGTRW